VRTGGVVDPNKTTAKKRVLFSYIFFVHGIEDSNYVFPEIKLRGLLVPNFHIHTSVSDLYIPTIGLPIWLQQLWTDVWEYINRSQSNECRNWH
jgi:hypothetical protein